jgi:general secretion pathway protein F
MPTFNYIAETADGRRLAGSLAAADEAAVRRELVARGLTPVDVSIEVAESSHPPRGDTATALVAAVGSAAEHRLPLELTLAALAEESGDRRLAAVARTLAGELQRGATMDEALAAVEPQLPTDIFGVFRAGVACGDLAGTLEEFSRQRTISQRIRRRIRAAVFYWPAPRKVIHVL